MGITYNGVSLDFCETESVEQVPEYDESGADMLWVTVRIHVGGVLNRGVDPAASFAVGGSTAGEAAALIRHKLLVPGKSLVYLAGGGNVVSRISLGGFPYSDAQLGPKPLYANVTAVTPNTIVFKFGVEVRVRECDAPAGLNRRYVSHRWEDSRSTDQAGFDTIRRSGLLITTGDVFGPRGEAAAGPGRPHPDDYGTLYLVTRPTPPGYRRERQSYTLDPTGLRLRYELVDRQLARTPPLPAVRMTGRQVESVERMSQLRYGEIQLRLEGFRGGTPSADNDHVVLRSLLNAAVRICLQRIEISKPFKIGPNDKVLVGGTFAESLDDDKYAVEVAMSWALRPDAARVGGVAADTSWLGTPLPGTYNPATKLPWTVQPPIRSGHQFVNPNAAKLFAAELTDVCGARGRDVRPHEYNPDLIDEALLVSGTPVSVTLPDNSTLTAVIGQVSWDDLNGQYNDTYKGIYAVYEAVIHYQHDDGVIVQPVTDPTKPRVAVRVHSPESSARVEWKAAKWGEPPELPARGSADPNAVFTRGTVSAMNVDVAADGATPLYSVAGVYEFEFLDPAAVQAVAPGTPYLDDEYVRANSLLTFRHMTRSDNPVNLGYGQSGNGPGGSGKDIFNQNYNGAGSAPAGPGA